MLLLNKTMEHCTKIPVSYESYRRMNILISDYNDEFLGNDY